MRKIDPRTKKQNYISGRRTGGGWKDIFRYGRPILATLRGEAGNILEKAPGLAMKGLTGRGVKQLTPDVQDKLSKHFSRLNAMI